MAEILPIRRKTLFNQSVNLSDYCFIYSSPNFIEKFNFIVFIEYYFLFMSRFAIRLFIYYITDRNFDIEFNSNFNCVKRILCSVEK